MVEEKKIEMEEMFERLRIDEIQARQAREEILAKMARQSQQNPPAELYQWVIYLPIIVFCVLFLRAMFRSLFRGIYGKLFFFFVCSFFCLYIHDCIATVEATVCYVWPLKPEVGPEPSLIIGWMFHFYIAYFIQGLHMLVESLKHKIYILSVPLFMFSYLMAYGLKTLVKTYVKHGVYHMLEAPQILQVLALWLGLHYIVCCMLQKLPRGICSNMVTIVVLLLEFAAFYWMNALDVTSLETINS